MPISRRLRYEILRRDDHACRYCGQKAPNVSLTVDHVLPIALGGADEAANLVTACQDCNAGKSSVAPDSPIVEGVSDDALRWAAAVAEAAAAQHTRSVERDHFIECFDDVWSMWGRGEGDARQLVRRPDDWKVSIGNFFDLGLGPKEAVDAIEIAMVKKNLRTEYGEWRYVCGICWGVLRKRQELAEQIIREQNA